jgi:uncharacterized membrane protein (UPF0127 family)
MMVETGLAMLLRPVLVLLVTAAVGCDRAAPEPVAATATAKSEGNATSGTSGTGAPTAAATGESPPSKAACVRPLAKTPPPPPTYSVDPKCPIDPAGGAPMVPVGHVGFPESKEAPALEVELMLTDPHQERGLMYRKKLADNKGMLFVWKQPSIHTFWMHNTCIPLDMLFIDRDGYIAGIVENAPTLNDDGRSIDCPVTYVLEVNAGWSRRHGVAPGQQVKIDGVP